MVNINQSENENEELKLSPLGTDEINSVIKSFKNSTFNQEELYKKDKPYLSSFYENPVREIPHNFFTQETKDYLLDFSKKIKMSHIFIIIY